jgi:hypothetical protein
MRIYPILFEKFVDLREKSALATPRITPAVIRVSAVSPHCAPAESSFPITVSPEEL